MPRLTKQLRCLFIAALWLGQACHCSAAEWNFASEFSTQANPGGQWSYGGYWDGDFHLMTIPVLDIFSNTDVRGWGGPYAQYGTGIDPDNLLKIVKNYGASRWGTPSTSHYLQAGEVYLLPGARDAVGQNVKAVVRWTAPSSGEYSILASFKGMYVGGTKADAQVNLITGGVIGAKTVLMSQVFVGTSYAETKSYQSSSPILLNAGDAIDFALGVGSDNVGYCDETVLQASISKTSDIARSIDAARKLGDGAPAQIDNLVVGSNIYNDNNDQTGFSVGQADRAAGLSVLSSVVVQPGDVVNLAGTVKNVNGEVLIQASSVIVTSTVVAPLPVAIKSISSGGGKSGSQKAVLDDVDTVPAKMATGMCNVGLLTSIYGKITKCLDDNSYSGSFYIDDGSGMKDSSGQIGVKCSPPADYDYYWMPIEGRIVAVSGAMGVRQINGLNVRYFRTQSWRYID